MKRFFEQIYQAILRHIDFDIVKCVIIGSPGFVREQVYDFIFAEAVVSTSSTRVKVFAWGSEMELRLTSQPFNNAKQ